jgi:hypothetical protein
VFVSEINVWFGMIPLRCWCVVYWPNSHNSSSLAVRIMRRGNNILSLILVALFFVGFDLCEANVECSPPIFRRRSLFRRLGAKYNNGLSVGQNVGIDDDDHGDDHGDDGHSEEHNSQGPQILFFFCIALVLGALTSYLLQRWNSKVPYTVVMFAEGMIAAVFSMHFDQGLTLIL